MGLDKATGEQNNNARWYDAIVGRWLSKDPIGFSAVDANLYRYCQNDPSDRTDATGLSWQQLPSGEWYWNDDHWQNGRGWGYFDQPAPGAWWYWNGQAWDGPHTEYKPPQNMPPKPSTPSPIPVTPTPGGKPPTQGGRFDGGIETDRYGKFKYRCWLEIHGIFADGSTLDEGLGVEGQNNGTPNPSAHIEYHGRDGGFFEGRFGLRGCGLWFGWGSKQPLRPIEEPILPDGRPNPNWPPKEY